MGRFAIMPMLIYENDGITDSEKMLLLLISGLSEKNGFCYATNEYLANERRYSVRTVQRQLKKLEKLGFLKVECSKDGYSRRIFLCLDRAEESDRDKGVTGGDTDVMGGDTDVMGGDICVAETGVSSDKIINNNINIKEKEIYKEKEKPNESEAVISLPLKDGEEFIVTEEYVKELILQYPDKEVREELKLMRAWLLDKPEKERKTRRGINRFIWSWLKRANASGKSNAPAPYTDATEKYIEKLNEDEKAGFEGYLAFKAKRGATQRE